MLAPQKSATILASIPRDPTNAWKSLTCLMIKNRKTVSANHSCFLTEVLLIAQKIIISVFTVEKEGKELRIVLEPIVSWYVLLGIEFSVSTT